MTAFLPLRVRLGIVDCWGTDQEAFISNDVAQSGTNSLKLESASPAGGPQDIMLIAGLGNGSYEVTFSLFVPDGFSGYYNVQENQIQGTDWAFETILYRDGNITYAGDGVVLLASTYQTNSWLTNTHYNDTESDLMHVYLNGDSSAKCLTTASKSEVSISTLQETKSTPLYYVDDVIVAVAALWSTGGGCGGAGMHLWPQPSARQHPHSSQLRPSFVRILGLDGKVVLEERRNDLMAGAQLEFDLQNGLYLVEISTAPSAAPSGWWCK